MAAVERLETLLRSLEALKPPGASGVKIQEITALCIENVQYESQLISKIYAQVCKSPASHKLGVLYVVDSVTRQWIIRAGQLGQPLVGSIAKAGTYAAGVHKMTEILPNIFDEVLVAYPENQKDKVKKLIDIWENAGTFPAHVIAGFRAKLASPTIRSRTPPGRPSPQYLASLKQAPQPQQPVPSMPAPTIPDSTNLLATLAALGQPVAADPISSVPQFQMPPANPISQQYSQQYDPRFAQPAANPQPVSVAPQLPFLAPPAAPSPFANAMNGSAPAAPQYAFNTAAATPVVQSTQGAPNAPVSSEIVMQLLQMMAQGQLTTEQSIQVMSLLGLAPPPGGPPAPLAQAIPSGMPPVPAGPANNFQNAVYDQSRQNGGNEYPDRRIRDRSRSRSPDFHRARASPPNRRDSPTYGAYDPSTSADGNNGVRPAEPSEKRCRNRGRRGDFRQRTPPAQRKAAESNNGPRNVHKNFEFDFNIPKGHIKVLSRTLFVGGVLGSEDELRAIFSRFGHVQTCTVNREKRHAFVKMYTRKDSVSAHAGMQSLQNDPDVQSKFRQTRWGVGFGPREYHNYENGVSVIPIKLLTEADRKWVVTAEYGGTGGEPIQDHLVIEEPDIEIGAGVSSKALSRRVQPGVPEPGGRRGGSNNNSNNNASNNNHGNGGSGGHGGHAEGGSGSNSGGGHGGGGGRSGRKRNRRQEKAEKRFSPAVRPDPLGLPEPATIVAPPPVPGFGFQLPGMR